MTGRLVSLPMYDAPRAALDRFRDTLCAGLERHGFSPEFVEPGDLFDHWRSAELLLSQTCGYPLTTALEGRVRLVGVPVYDAPGCDGPFYRSAIVVRAGDPAIDLGALRGRIAVFNAPHSQSGYNAFRAAVAPLAEGRRFFSSTLETGSHRASLDAVLDARADVAAIDAVTLALALDREPDLPLRTLTFTPSAPGLPFVTNATASDTEVEALVAALRAALDDAVAAGTAGAMRLRGIEHLPLSAYDLIAVQENTAVALGYPTLA